MELLLLRVHNQDICAFWLSERFMHNYSFVANFLYETLYRMSKCKLLTTPGNPDYCRSEDMVQIEDFAFNTEKNFFSGKLWTSLWEQIYLTLFRLSIILLNSLSAIPHMKNSVVGVGITLNDIICKNLSLFMVRAR